LLATKIFISSSATAGDKDFRVLLVTC